MLEIEDVFRERESMKGNFFNHDVIGKEYLFDIGTAISCRKGNYSEGANQDNYFTYIDQFSKVFVIADGHGK